MTDPLSQPDLRTRLRELRKSHGWTLAQVAERLGTTPQTVSRLETNVMTVSTDWLQKFATLFGVSAADLIADQEARTIVVIGAAAADGCITPHPPAPLPVALALDDGLAVRAAANIGPYREGSYVVASRLTGRNVAAATGHACLCETEQGALWLAYLIDGLEGRFTLVPLGGGDVHYDVNLKWVARVRLEIHLSD